METKIENKSHRKKTRWFGTMKKEEGVGEPENNQNWLFHDVKESEIQNVAYKKFGGNFGMELRPIFSVSHRTSTNYIS